MISDYDVQIERLNEFGEVLSQTFLDVYNPQFTEEILFFKLKFNYVEIIIDLTSVNYPTIRQDPEVVFKEHCLRQGNVRDHEMSYVLLDICGSMVI